MYMQLKNKIINFVCLKKHFLHLIGFLYVHTSMNTSNTSV